MSIPKAWSHDLDFSVEGANAEKNRAEKRSELKGSTEWCFGILRCDCLDPLASVPLGGLGFAPGPRLINGWVLSLSCLFAPSAHLLFLPLPPRPTS